MQNKPLKILAIGATGSIGVHVIAEALAQGHTVRALVRRPGKLQQHAGVEEVVADLAVQQSLRSAVQDVNAVVFTHGTYGSVKDAELVDYGGVRNVLEALSGRRVRIALMTAIAVTDRKGAHDWKRRAERLVRASGHAYTIVRPGWFDYNEPDQLHLLFLQGDKRRSGTPDDGVISRRQIARVLVHSLSSTDAKRKTLELIARTGPEQTDLDPLFAVLDADPAGVPLDAIYDTPNMAFEREPESVKLEIAAIIERSLDL